MRAQTLALALAALLAPTVLAPAARAVAAPAEKAARKDPASPLGNLGGGGKEPIKIDADRLDVFDRENKAVFAGNVVAVQGDSTIRCSTMTVHYRRGKEKDGKGKGDGQEPGASEPGTSGSAADKAENGIQKVECAGPVTVVQKDQVATGDSAVFDQAAKRIVLTGNVVLSQCRNVTRGQRLVYDMGTGRANMDPVAGGRVSALFVPGEKAEGAKAGAGCPPPPSLARPAAKEGAALKEGTAPEAGKAETGKTRAEAR